MVTNRVLCHLPARGEGLGTLIEERGAGAYKQINPPKLPALMTYSRYR